jgi:hypothetical protein
MLEEGEMATAATEIALVYAIALQLLSQPIQLTEEAIHLPNFQPASLLVEGSPTSRHAPIFLY